MKAIQLPTKARMTSDLVPDLQLTHGRALWVLTQMGFAAGVTPMTFTYYVKSLRRLGVPFAHGEITTGSGKPVHYSFNHMMELSLALTLRIYGALPDPVLLTEDHGRNSAHHRRSWPRQLVRDRPTRHRVRA